MASTAPQDDLVACFDLTKAPSIRKLAIAMHFWATSEGPKFTIANLSIVQQDTMARIGILQMSDPKLELAVKTLTNANREVDAVVVESAQALRDY
ncbi:hypothetical protein B2J93_3328 [Marssonina coronariae]|uniref:Uncharacterized protein n=1 Tax=Diplocarpon coronariae TaxID=2795749 RepID=A0A218ZAZ0_9HELO|nr:hypothetical protein B2J93_3328 [Marssonina coronariae]